MSFMILWNLSWNIQFFLGGGGGVEVHKHVACRIVESYSYNFQIVKMYNIGTSVTDIGVQTHGPLPPASKRTNSKT